VPGVSDSSPLIFLSALRDLDLLRQIVGEIFIPRAVYREVVVDGHGKPRAEEVERAMGNWISVVGAKDTSKVTKIMDVAGLQSGESEAIVLADQLHIGAIVLDDQQAVLEARSRGLTVLRTPAIYLAAKRAGLIAGVKPKLDTLRTVGFRLRDDHYQLILDRAEES
jgi:predicted nucleic acid-binding protein